MDKSIVMFYWDYWAMGEESAFLSIGGGCPDIFVLDRSGLPRDLNKMFRNPVIRNAGELPLNHFERYHNYWRWSPGQKQGPHFFVCRISAGVRSGCGLLLFALYGKRFHSEQLCGKITSYGSGYPS